MYPGRWNRKGQRAIYTSLSLSTAVLETLAHVNKTEIPSGMVKMEIRINRGDAIAPANLLVQFRQSIAAAKAHPDVYSYSDYEIARFIPSVIVPEFNVVLNPSAEFFRDVVEIASIEPFEFDPRLFPEGASSKGVAGAS